MPPNETTEPCPICEIVAGRVRPPGGIVHRDPLFVAYGYPDASPVRGYVLVATTRHARGLYDLTEAEAAALGPLVVRIQRAQKSALGADHAYAFVLGDKVHHVHTHLVPRFPDSPANLRGGGLFTTANRDARPLDEIEAACRAIERELRRS